MKKTFELIVSKVLSMEEIFRGTESTVGDGEIVLGQPNSPPEIPTQLALQMSQTQNNNSFPLSTFPLAQSQISQLTMSQNLSTQQPQVRPLLANVARETQATQDSYSTCGFGAIERMLATQNNTNSQMPSPQLAPQQQTNNIPRVSTDNSANGKTKTNNAKPKLKRKAQAKNKMRPQEAPRAERGNMFDDEVMCLLDTIEVVLPCGPKGWKTVENEHHKEGWPASRTAPNLRKKWQSLLKDAVRYKTGDPDITEIQQRTREVGYKLQAVIRVKDPSVEGGTLWSILGRRSASSDVTRGKDNKTLVESCTPS